MPKSGFKTALAGLVKKRQLGGALDPTLIYTNTTKGVDEIVAWINGSLPASSKGVAVAGAYHSKLSSEARLNAHRAFLRDDHEIMVATVAYGESSIKLLKLRCLCGGGVWRGQVS